MSEIRTSVEIPVGFRRCVDHESTRYALGYVNCLPATPDTYGIDSDGKATGERGTCILEATNSRILAIREVEGSTEEKQLVPFGILPTAKNKTRVTLNGQWENQQGKFAPINEEPGRFPKCADILPEATAEMVIFTLDADLLADLQSAIKSGDNKDRGSVTLFYNPANPEGAIGVLGYCGVGAIMPLCAPNNQNLAVHTAESIANYNEKRNRHRAIHEATATK